MKEIISIPIFFLWLKYQRQDLSTFSLLFQYPRPKYENLDPVQWQAVFAVPMVEEQLCEAFSRHRLLARHNPDVGA
jgi:hypothetical protein